MAENNSDFMENVKMSFKMAKEDISTLEMEINKLKQIISEQNNKILDLMKKIEESRIRADLEGFSGSSKNSSIGNGGVPTDKPTNQQTLRPTNQQTLQPTNQHFSTMFLRASFARGKTLNGNEMRCWTEGDPEGECGKMVSSQKLVCFRLRRLMAVLFSN